MFFIADLFIKEGEKEEWMKQKEGTRLTIGVGGEWLLGGRSLTGAVRHCPSWLSSAFALFTSRSMAIITRHASYRRLLFSPALLFTHWFTPVRISLDRFARDDASPFFSCHNLETKPGIQSVYSSRFKVDSHLIQIRNQYLDS